MAAVTANRLLPILGTVVLLMLALTQSKDPAQIQRWFQQF